MDFDLVCLIKACLVSSEADKVLGLVSGDSSGVKEARAVALAISMSEEHFSIVSEEGTVSKVSGRSV